MKYKLDATNNPNTAGNSHIGKTHRFDFNGTVFYFGSIRSSTVKSITIEDDTMIVQTRNTKYTFKKDVL